MGERFSPYEINNKSAYSVKKVFRKIIYNILKQHIMRNIWILISFIFIELGLSTSAQAQDKIITKNGDVIQGWNVEISEKFVFYCTENKADAAIKRMEKDKVLMVKRQNGSTVNLYEDAQPAAEQATATAETATSEPVMLKVSDLNEAAKKTNEELISHMNDAIVYKPEEGEDDEDANRALIGFGVKDGSVMDDGNVSISFVLGTMFKAGKKKAPVFRKEFFYEEHVLYNPAIVVRVENKSNRTIYLDLGNSFFVRMGKSMCYYVPSSTTTNSSSTSGGAVNLGSIAGAFGVGGVVGTLANGVNVGGSGTNGTSNTTYAQRVISIPPKASYDLNAIYLFGNEDTEISTGLHYSVDISLSSYDYCLRMAYKEEKLKNGSHYKYTAENSPIEMSAIVAYSFSESCTDERMMPVNLYMKDLIGIKKNIIKGKTKGELNVLSEVLTVMSKAKDSKDEQFPLP